MKKFLDPSEAWVGEQEKEIDNLQSTLAYAQKKAVERYKASSEYARVMNSYKEKVMAASISLTKEWIAIEYPFIDPSVNDRRSTRGKMRKAHHKERMERLHTWSDLVFYCRFSSPTHWYFFSSFG